MESVDPEYGDEPAEEGREVGRLKYEVANIESKLKAMCVQDEVDMPKTEVADLEAAPDDGSDRTSADKELRP